jgi:bifunctional ADP-heptose synthase (sugar kinase/adenylyltransferase)
VAGVTIFNSTRLVDEILILKPDIYAKAGDYDESKINTDEHEALKEVKSKIEFVSFLPGRSTSSLINNIVSNFD